MTDSEKMREAAARWCADEADRCEDAAKWGGNRKYVQDCKAAAFALRNAWSAIRALPLPEPTEARVKAAAPYMATVQNADPCRCLNPFDDLITALGFNENQSTMSDKPTEALVAAERALWVQAIETYFDATAVMDVEKHVERLRAEGKRETT